MKRCFILFVVLASFFRFSALAQTASTAAAIAEKQDTEERFKRISADLESLQAANALLQKKIAALEEELNKVREEQTRSANNSSAQDDVKILKEKIQEVDRKRQADTENVVAQLKRLGETLAAPAPRSTKKVISSTPDETATHSSPEKPTSDKPEKGFSYTIEDGDTLDKIRAAYNAEFKIKGMKTLTQKQVMDANPNVNWNKLRIGQKIFIPAPAPAK